MAMVRRRVAFAAVCFVQFIANIDWMNKVCHLCADRDVLLSLTQNFVAQFAVFGDHPACGGLVFSVMAAETTRSIEMTDMVWIGVPLDFHFREEVA